MTNAVKHFAEIVSSRLDMAGPVYEFGSLQDPAREDRADLRPLFPGLEYVGCDLVEGPGVDVVMNVEAPSLADASVGTVLVLETLEHVRFPNLAASECARILRPEGWAVFSTVFNFSLHMVPLDYWRFTPYGLALLLEREFRVVRVWKCGEAKRPKHVVAVATKCPAGREVLAQRLEAAMSRWEARWSPSN